MKKIFVRLILIFTILCSSLYSKASDPSLNFIHYTNEDGLPSSYVKSITQDKDGFIWLATRLSVCRFDGNEFRVFPFFDKKHEEIAVYCNKVINYQDSLLIARSNSGFYYYFDKSRECFKEYNFLNKLGSVSQIFPENSGLYILANGKILFTKKGAKDFTSIQSSVVAEPSPDLEIVSFYVKDYLLSSLHNDHSVLITDLRTGKSEHIPLPDVLQGEDVTLHYIDEDFNIWISEESSGVVRYKPLSHTFDHFHDNETNKFYIPHNMVHSFAKDETGRIWIGTEGGLAIYDPKLDVMEIHHYNPTKPNGLNTEPIYDAFCDRNGNMWLGTFFGGINLCLAKENFFRTWHSGIGDWQIGGNVVSCFAEDKDNNLWIGLEDMGLNKLNTKTGEVIAFTEGNDNKGLTYNNLHDLLFVDDSILWIASYTGGINILNTKTGIFKHLLESNTPGLHTNIVYCFFRLNNSILIGTNKGIVKYDLSTNNFSSFREDVLKYYQFESIARSRNTLLLSSQSEVFCYDLDSETLKRFDKVPEMNDINFVKVDSKERIWIGDCYDGLICYDKRMDSIIRFNNENNFPATWIFSLEEANEDWFWASSDKGLIKFSALSGQSILFDNNSGIPFNQFNYRASFIDSKNNVYFGGNNGMVSFNKDDEHAFEKSDLNIVFTGLQLFNKQVSPGKQSIINTSINDIEELIFKYEQNVFTLEFKALNFSQKSGNQYAYYLEGFEEEWNYVGNRTFATYTNLSPGKYTFHVKASSNNIREATNIRKLPIRIKPPFYLTYWAFLIYVLLVIFFSMVIYRVGKNLEKSRTMVALERQEKEHSEAIHLLKLEFFTNISHELKTPLTLILGPINKFLEEEKLSPNSRKRLLGIEKNAHRLFQLINQLLEFRKIETGKETLLVSKTNVNSVFDGIIRSFDNLIELKDIEFNVKLPAPDTKVWMDRNKIDKIIFNLLSNAFKFTPEGGVIEFHTAIRKHPIKGKNTTKWMDISISDTGIGIRPEMLDKVFERFVQVNDSQQKVKGSGIGLAYVKSLVGIHKGTITAESKADTGSVFRVSIPVSKIAYETSEISSNNLQVIEAHSRFIPEETNTKSPTLNNSDRLSRKPLIMIVEDNEELIEFMTESLEEKFQIVIANNGLEGLNKLKEISPELIISDIIMPEMDGFEFVTQLKQDLKTSHIPVILLTSKGGVENRLKGLKTGADFYIQKPFYPRILEQNIENIITTRQKFIEKYKENLNVNIHDVAVSESDKSFLEKLNKIIQDNISDSEMDVSFLVNEMGLSRSMLHLKLKGLLQCSTTEYIRTVRVKEAVKLISSGKCNISEAAYASGFSSPTYFTRRFKEMYGKSPRDYFNTKNCQ